MMSLIVKRRPLCFLSGESSQLLSGAIRLRRLHTDEQLWQGPSLTTRHLSVFLWGPPTQDTDSGPGGRTPTEIVAQWQDSYPQPTSGESDQGSGGSGGRDSGASGSRRFGAEGAGERRGSDARPGPAATATDMLVPRSHCREYRTHNAPGHQTAAAAAHRPLAWDSTVQVRKKGGGGGGGEEEETAAREEEQVCEEQNRGGEGRHGGERSVERSWEEEEEEEEEEEDVGAAAEVTNKKMEEEQKRRWDLVWTRRREPETRRDSRPEVEE
ncbi:hypothetical protein N1851_012260 [Merluccius polli]|uniref:Uncharacterized protein n=1 Tax=Merluccius polli TaxID=89951 RepID=A0AA47P2F2_MERPO|nr:hypothetical protein N1851_012260 [Merluccius polli]